MAQTVILQGSRDLETVNVNSVKVRTSFQSDPRHPPISTHVEVSRDHLSTLRFLVTVFQSLTEQVARRKRKKKDRI